MKQPVLNLDPSRDLQHQSIKTVRPVFGLWDYRLTVDTTVAGCSGLEAIEFSAMRYYDENVQTGFLLTREADGDVLLCKPDEDDVQDEKYLLNMLVSGEIIDVRPIHRDSAR